MVVLLYVGQKKARRSVWKGGNEGEAEVVQSGGLDEVLVMLSTELLGVGVSATKL